MFLDANQKKTKGPNKLFEICNRPVFEESKERYKSFIKSISSLLLNLLQFSPQPDDECLLLQQVWLHKPHGHRDNQEGVEAAQQQQHLGVHPDL